ncbi:MAG: hypothetical protein GWO20_04065, partial [Candidatus Korarchaeota archaeon]|nr:hypothetical protein [Candidatus Korarchaeota archaeon]NIU83216.1 hypothetical protein [Candidatus Thorarchaeota archaeon]NIW13580.1 hypothetical protein [Candidatus Thorarchaeota archaeon]NIW51689.1 hypothetical protein [Candidatus Korarchaeota archaeon]
DICIVPLRVTVNDAGRTALILRELQKKSGLGKKEFINKIIFLFSIVPYYKQDKIDTYKDELYKTFPGAQFFEQSIKKTVSFTRVSTNQQKSKDIKKVEDAF